jgi:Ca-activated chloride channel family protein
MAMRQRVVILALAGAALASLAAGVAPQSGSNDEQAQVRITQVDTSGFPQVKVYVSVTDARGEPLGVDPERIVLQENGNAVPIDDVRAMGEAEPLSTLLVIDVSGSMNEIGKLQAAKEAARSYVGQMREADQAGVIAFNTKVRVVQPLTHDRQALAGAIDSLQASDDTALYDGVAAGIEALDEAEGRRAILVLSDGMDNSSQITPEQALAGIGPAGLSISTIGLGDPARAPGEWAGLDVETLRQLAEQAGGSYSAVSDAEALRALYLRLGRELQSEFVVSYTSPSKLRDGVDRSLSVSLAEVNAPSPAQAEYNPGGLVPEVPQPAPWPVFLGALAVLAALVVIPMTGRALMQRAGRRGQPRKATGERARIRLEEPREPRVRLR